MSSSRVEIGPFAISRKNAHDFCQNLYLGYAINECAQHMKKVQEEYEEAILKADDELAEQKRLELQTYQSSLQLTAYMFEVDEVST